ncbi:hypothetical protein R3Q15_09410 [Gordonia amicalis]|uniref:Uncharacterized protein n=1 Tax=Gordonia amicalis TaxID=89053 RepID=A0AAE4R2N1_9ACTN|nr:hypothetical protein [Gordonia amicalis]MDV6312099.1 hypothetical protein [Gordonia amicalis]
MRWLGRDPEVEDYGRRYYLGVIAGAAALSVVGNMLAFAVDELDPAVVLFIHAIPPLIAVLMIHMVATIRGSFMGSIRRDPTTRQTTRAWPPLEGYGARFRRWLRSWSYGDVVLATVLITLTTVALVVTLGVSAVSLAAVGEMAGWEGRVSWALPLMLDLPALIATVGFIKAGHRRSEDARAAAVEDEAHEADQAAVEQVAQSGEPVSGEADGTRAEVVSRGSDHQAAQPVDRPAPRHAAQGEPTPVAQPVDHGSAPVTQPVDHGVIREPARPVDRAAHTCDLREPEVIREGDEADQVGIEPIPADLEQVIQEVIREANREWFTVSRGSDEPVDQWLSHEADHPADHEPVQEVIREANHDVDQAREPRPSREPIRPSHGSAAAEDRLAELARQTAEALGGDADEDLIRQALVLQESGLSLRKTSTELDVPYSTLRRWVARAKELAEATPRLRVISN